MRHAGSARNTSRLSVNHSVNERGALPVRSSTVDVVSAITDSRNIWSSPTKDRLRAEKVRRRAETINFMQYEGWEWGKMAAGGTLVMLPVIVFPVLVRKWLVSGLMAGSVKD
jgi:hypothetical protein